MASDSGVERQPLPLLAQVPPHPRTAAQPAIADDGLPVPDREPAAWYRLVTAIASCYVYVVAHTQLEPCTFEIEQSGRARCRLGDETQWELSLPAAAYRQFEYVVARWRMGAFNDSAQAQAVRLSEPYEPLPGVRAVDVLPTEDQGTRTQTLARR